MTDYSWIKQGAKARIKTVKEIEEMYPNGMPCGLVDGMLIFCGTTQEIQSTGTSYSDRYETTVYICHYNWPNTVLLLPTTPKGNSF
jgi:hypothetical protein